MSINIDVEKTTYNDTVICKLHFVTFQKFISYRIDKFFVLLCNTILSQIYYNNPLRITKHSKKHTISLL